MSASTPRSATRAATEAAFARAAHVAKLETWMPRVAGSPMEPRAAVGEYDAATGRYTIHAGNGSARRLHKRPRRRSSTLPEDELRVVMRDVGGNFGTRGAIFPSKRWWPGRRAASAGR